MHSDLPNCAACPSYPCQEFEYERNNTCIFSKLREYFPVLRHNPLCRSYHPSTILFTQMLRKAGPSPSGMITSIRHGRTKCRAFVFVSHPNLSEEIEYRFHSFPKKCYMHRSPDNDSGSRLAALPPGSRLQFLPDPIRRVPSPVPGKAAFQLPHNFRMPLEASLF